MSEMDPAAIDPAAPPPVVVHEETSALTEEAKKRPRGAPKWETDSRDRIKAAIRRFSKPLQELVARDANEGDTRLLVTDFLTEGLGYDKYADLTTEYAVKGEFADYGVRIDRELVAFIETKRAGTALKERHLRQIEMYAVNEGVEWLILTNGSRWAVYHLTGGLPVQIDLALDVDLLGDDTPANKANALFYISRDALKRRLIDELWKARAAPSPRSFGAVLTSPTVLTALRRELRRQTKQNVDEKEIATLLRDTILRPECFEN